MVFDEDISSSYLSLVRLRLVSHTPIVALPVLFPLTRSFLSHFIAKIRFIKGIRVQLGKNPELHA